jgi:outer membrane protein assembly factor BamE
MRGSICRPEAALMYHVEVPLSMVFTMRIKLIVVSVLLVSCSEMTMPKLPSFTAHKMEINQGNMVTPEMRHKLKLGMTRLQVQAVLGTPLVNDAFHASRWDYVYRLEKKGKLLEKQRMTLYFEGDYLTRIDDGNMPALPAMVVPVSTEPVGEN